MYCAISHNTHYLQFYYLLDEKKIIISLTVVNKDRWKKTEYFTNIYIRIIYKYIFFEFEIIIHSFILKIKRSYYSH